MRMLIVRLVIAHGDTQIRTDTVRFANGNPSLQARPKVGTRALRMGHHPGRRPNFGAATLTIS